MHKACMMLRGSEKGMRCSLGQALPTLLISVQALRLFFQWATSFHYKQRLLWRLACSAHGEMQWPLAKLNVLFMPSKCPTPLAIASYNSLDFALRAHLHLGSMTTTEMAKIRPDPQVQRKYANLTKSLKQHIHKHQRSDEGDRRYAKRR